MYEDGRISRAAECDITLDENNMVLTRTVLFTLRYIYDQEGTLIRKHVIPADNTCHEIFFYEEDSNDNSVLKVKLNEKIYTSHSKTDSFGRKEFEEIQTGFASIFRQFQYHAGQTTEEHIENGMVKSAPTTNLVKQILLSDGRTISYEYDPEERITKVIDSVEGTIGYSYDAQGQLKEEYREVTSNTGEITKVPLNTMDYDAYGNITVKNGKVYGYDTTWKDMLISYDGQSITYDAQGNPLTYLGHTLTWEKGRQLKSFDRNTYAYNANGIRTSKTVNDVKHTYTLDGTKILCETWGDNTLIPLYDNEEGVCGIQFKGENFYFLKNLQGDVIAICDENGETEARYSYDAWGVCSISVDSSNCDIANINPFRYRGYYYDAEIGMYYLQSRYYNPVLGRFVNSDYPDIITTVNVKHSTNLYCYCSNNSTNETDACGNLIASAIAKFVIYAVFGVFVQFISDIIEFLLRKFIKRKNVPFSLSPLGDYLGSALSWGMCSLNLFNNKLAAFLAPFVPVLVKHLANIIRGSFSWYALLVDVAAAFIAGIISVALNKSMKNKLSKVKRGKGNRYSDYSKYLKKQQKIIIKINKSFFKASLTIVIATTLMQLLLNLLLK